MFLRSLEIVSKLPTFQKHFTLKIDTKSYTKFLLDTSYKNLKLYHVQSEKDMLHEMLILRKFSAEFESNHKIELELK